MRGAKVASVAFGILAIAPASALAGKVVYKGGNPNNPATTVTLIGKKHDGEITLKRVRVARITYACANDGETLPRVITGSFKVRDNKRFHAKGLDPREIGALGKARVHVRGKLGNKRGGGKMWIDFPDAGCSTDRPRWKAERV